MPNPIEIKNGHLHFTPCSCQWEFPWAEGEMQIPLFIRNHWFIYLIFSILFLRVKVCLSLSGVVNNVMWLIWNISSYGSIWQLFSGRCNISANSVSNTQRCSSVHKICNVHSNVEHNIETGSWSLFLIWLTFNLKGKQSHLHNLQKKWYKMSAKSFKIISFNEVVDKLIWQCSNTFFSF